MISHPLNQSRRPTACWAVSVSLHTWLYSAVFASMPFFGVGKYVPEGYLTGCSFDYLSNDLAPRIFILIFFIGAWVIPLSITLYSYFSITRVIAQSRRNVAQIGNQGNCNNAPNKKFKKFKKRYLKFIFFFMYLYFI